MTSQLVAFATQSRNAAGLDELEELDELEDDPVPHMFISACLQLVLSLELVLEVDVPKHVPHLAMTLLTAFSHLDDNAEDNVEDGQPAPATAKIERTNPRSARFMSLLPTKVIGRVYQQSAADTAGDSWRSVRRAIDDGFPVRFRRAAVVVGNRW